MQISVLKFYMQCVLFFWCSECGLLNIDHMCDEEEIVIQTTLNELEESEEPSNMFSSRIDPYTHVRYGSLRDEIGVVEEMKCIAGAADLKELLGNYCRLPGCNMKIRCTEIKATCGYALKLEWLCEAMHRGIWYSSSIYASGFAVNYVVETALLAGMNHHQFQRFANSSTLCTHHRRRMPGISDSILPLPFTKSTLVCVMLSSKTSRSKTVLCCLVMDAWIHLDSVQPRQHTHLWKNRAAIESSVWSMAIRGRYVC